MRVFKLFLFLFGLFFPHVIHATIYQPGETLTPDCAPESPNCGIATLSLNGQSSSTQTFVVGAAGTDFTIVSGSNIHTFNIPNASALSRGVLSSVDWSAFNNKENAITASSTAAYYRGDKTFQILDTSVVPENGNLYFTNARAREALSSSIAGLTYATGTGLFSLVSGYTIPLTASSTQWDTAYANRITSATGPLSLGSNMLSLTQSSGMSDGYLSSIDWSAFSNKLTSSLADGKMFIGNGSNLAMAVTLSGDATILNTGLLTLADSGVTAGVYGSLTTVPIFTIDAKGRITTIATSSVAGIALSGDVGGTLGATQLGNSSVTTAKIANNAIDGTKIALGSDTSGDVMYYDGTDWTRLGIGTAGQFLQTNGAATAPTWGTLTDISGTNVTTTNLAVLTGLSLPSNSVTDVMVVPGLTIDATGSVSASAVNSGTLGNAAVTLALSSFGSITGSLSDSNLSDGLTISGGTINNTPIGATTPSTGAFTSLTATSATSTVWLGFATASGTTMNALSGTINALTSQSATLSGGSINGMTIGASKASTGVFTNVTTTNLGTTAISASLFNGNAKTLSIGGAATNINLGAAGVTVLGGGAFTLNSGAATTLALDGGTTGAINIGTGANAKTITIGNSTGATTLNFNAGTGNINFQAAGTGTTGRVQIGAGGSGSATPDLLVLDTKNTSGDPTGTNGAMYYNSNTNKFRCYENTAWIDCIGTAGSSIFKGKQSDQAVTGNITLTDESDLSFSIASGQTWAVNYELYITNNNSGQPDLQLAILGASGWTCSFQMSGIEAAGANFPQVVTTDCDNIPTALVNASVANDSSKGITIHVLGTITATSAGSVTLQFAQNTSSTNPLTIKAGSFVEAFKTAGSDVAEIYYGQEPLSPGTVVSIDPTLPAGVVKSSGLDDANVLGVVSTKPGLIIGDSKGPVNGIPTFIALSGRVPVQVSAENGPIKIGDYLTSSSIPGAAMRRTESGKVVGQALSAFDGDTLGQVLMFVKNIDLDHSTVLMGDVSPKKSKSDEADSGLKILVTTIQSESAHDPIAIITSKISEGKQFLTDFVAARVTAIRGYFDEVFTKKIHTEQVCVKKADGTEVCVDGDQLQNAIGGLAPGSQAVPVQVPAPEAPIDVVLPVSEAVLAPIQEQIPDAVSPDPAPVVVPIVDEAPPVNQAPVAEPSAQ